MVPVYALNLYDPQDIYNQDSDSCPELCVHSYLLDKGPEVP